MESAYKRSRIADSSESEDKYSTTKRQRPFQSISDSSESESCLPALTTLNTSEKRKLADSESDDPAESTTSSGASYIKRQSFEKQNAIPKVTVKRVLEANSEEDSTPPVSVKQGPAKTPARNGTAKPAAQKAKKVKKENGKVENGVSTERPANDEKSVKKDSVKKEPTKKDSVKKEPTKKDYVKKEPEKKDSVKKESTKKEPGTAKRKAATSSQDAEQAAEEEYKWWLDQSNADGSIKWTHLEHNGVYFPPDYVPHGVKLKYDGKPIDLGPEAEEIATLYAGLIGTQYPDNPVFVKNFFDDFMAIIKRTEKNCPIKSLDKCDFGPIVDHLNTEREKKKNLTKLEKDALKVEKLAIDEKYGWATIDGRREKVGNFRVEPPGLFRGRGEHPRSGKFKKRLYPEDITLNIGENAKAPELPPGRRWKQIVHDPSVTWLASWIENINNQAKYVFLAASSSWKGMSDFKKFEKARELKKHVERIRAEYTEMLKDREMVKRQLATAMYFIDKFALRAGNEKGEDEADTVGCCSLRYEHITLKENCVVVFDFPGKDSIRYYNEVLVDPQVHKNLKLFQKGHANGDALFDRIETSSLNRHLQSLMPGLTAKVFRTFNASYTFQKELQATPAEGEVAQKILAYNAANRHVAILCNHQRTVPKGLEGQLAKMVHKIRGIKYERNEIRKKILKHDPKLKKKNPAYAQEETDIDEEFIRKYLQEEAEKEEEKKLKKLEKLNSELGPKDKKLTLADLPEKIVREPTLEQLEKKFLVLSKRILDTQTNMQDRDDNKTTALSTSKINYIDPRITAAWCYKHNVPLDRMFAKTLREKFKWAQDVDAYWEF